MTYAWYALRRIDLSTSKLSLVAMLLAVLTVAGCGGSSGKKELTAEGTAQKGLFQALEVQAFPLDETNGELGEAVEVVVTEQTFSAAIAHEQLTLFEATGTFTSEITGTVIQKRRGSPTSTGLGMI